VTGMWRKISTPDLNEPLAARQEHGRRDSENADETTPQVTDLTPASAELPEECRLSRRPCLPVWSPGWAHGRDVLVAVGGGGELEDVRLRHPVEPVGQGVRSATGSAGAAEDP
jgi:hypothetical protein